MPSWQWYAAVILAATIALLGLAVAPFVGPYAVGERYHTIQQAIDAARPGAIVLVPEGHYRENLVITKPVRLLASRSKRNPPGEAILEPIDGSRPTISVRAPRVEIVNFTLRGGLRAVDVEGAQGVRVQGNHIIEAATAVGLRGSSQSTIARNVIARSPIGIALQSSRANQLRSNRIERSADVGIWLRESEANELENNVVTDSGRGLVVHDSAGNALDRNRLARNQMGFLLTGSAVDHFGQRIARTNVVDGWPIYYISDAHDVTIRTAQPIAYLAIVNSVRVTATGLTLRNSVDGIVVVNSRDVELLGNQILQSQRGLWLWQVRNAELRENVVDSCQETGIEVRESEGSLLLNNSIRACGVHGIRVLHSAGTRLHSNHVEAHGQHGITLEYSVRSAVRENTVRGNKEAGIYLSHATETSIENNAIEGNWIGLHLVRAEDNVIRLNWVRQNQFGLFLDSSRGNRITENDLKGNNRSGVAGVAEGNTIGDNEE